MMFSFILFICWGQVVIAL